MNQLTKTDKIFVIIAAVLVYILGVLSLTTGLTDWGDDSAAYINEGIAIAEGELDKQAEINYYYHPTDIPDEAVSSGKLFYVWGYPLILAGIYKLFGFSYDNVIIYKFPSLLCLSLTAAVIYLFFRKRKLPSCISLAVSVLFCLSSNLFTALNSLYSDLVFLFFTTLTLFLMECFFEKNENGRLNAGFGILYGIVLWFTYETRLSGSGVCAIAFLGHLIAFITRSNNKKKTFWPNFLPYLLLGILVIVSERLWLAPATSNLSDINSAVDHKALVAYYIELFHSYFSSLVFEGYIVFVLFAVGLIFIGLKKENLHLTVFIVVTLFVVIILPYIQSLRYVYNILPFVLLYSTSGLVTICNYIKKLISSRKDLVSGTKTAERISRIVSVILTVFVMAFAVLYPVTRIADNISHWKQRGEGDVYSDDALIVYQYIKDNIPEEAAVCCSKPRMLYLNTKHKAFVNDVNGHKISDADYYLLCKHDYFSDFSFLDSVDKEVVIDNSAFTLYRLSE